MKQKPGLLLRLFWTFFKIGAFTFGGGYAMLPLIESECVEKYGWITGEELLRVTVIAESTPGPVAINCATYVGNKKAGFAGALACTFGVVLPSFVIILALSFFLDRFLEIPLIAKAFRGIRIAVAILILRAGLRMLLRMEKKPLPLILFGAAFAAMLAISIFSLPVSTIALLGAAAAVSLSISLAKAWRERKGGAGQ
jgi:chromate transporter